MHVHLRDAGRRVDDRETFGRRVVDDDRSSQFDPRGTSPGGQAVTAARQAHALGADVHLYGHGDDPLFDVPFPVTSTGGGDRFSAPPACALADDWPWRRALALANARASYHVATGATADGTALGSFTRGR